MNGKGRRDMLYFGPKIRISEAECRPDSQNSTCFQQANTSFSDGSVGHPDICEYDVTVSKAAVIMRK